LANASGGSKTLCRKAIEHYATTDLDLMGADHSRPISLIMNYLAKEKRMKRIILVILTLSSLAIPSSRAQTQDSKKPDPPVVKILAIGRLGSSPMTPEIHEKTLPTEVRETVKLHSSLAKSTSGITGTITAPSFSP
jgi:hypothetical protein